MLGSEFATPQGGKDVADSRDKPSADNPFGIPGFDLGRMLEQFQMPGFDPAKLMENERRNIEALREANQAVMDGWGKLAEKQAEIFRESMAQWQQAMQQRLGSDTPGPEQQAEMARKGFEHALENMREMAEITAESQGKAYEIMRKRMEENIQSFFDRQRKED